MSNWSRDLSKTLFLSAAYWLYKIDGLHSLASAELWKKMPNNPTIDTIAPTVGKNLVRNMPRTNTPNMGNASFGAVHNRYRIIMPRTTIAALMA